MDVSGRVASAGMFFLAAVVLSPVWGGGAARAAADWEWTANQGWSMAAGQPRGSAEEQMQYAYDLEVAGNLMDASKQYFLLLRHWPHAPDAGVALQRLAKCLFQMENYYSSYKAINQVLQTYPQSGRVDDLLAIELKIGQRLLEQRQTTIFGNPGEVENQSLRQAIEVFEAVIRAREFGTSAAEAYLGLGDAYFRLSDYRKSRDAYQTALDNFPKQPEIAERARYGIMQIEAMQGTVDLNRVEQQGQVVRSVLEDYRANQPVGYDEDYDPVRAMDAATMELHRKEAQKLLSQAQTYGRVGTASHTRSSLFLYGEIVRRFPETPQADIAREKLGTTPLPKDPSQASKFVKGLNPKNWNFFGREEPPAFVVDNPDPITPADLEPPIPVDTGVAFGPETSVYATAPYGVGTTSTPVPVPGEPVIWGGGTTAAAPVYGNGAPVYGEGAPVYGVDPSSGLSVLPTVSAGSSGSMPLDLPMPGSHFSTAAPTIAPTIAPTVAATALPVMDPGVPTGMSPMNIDLDLMSVPGVVAPQSLLSRAEARP